MEATSRFISGIFSVKVQSAQLSKKVWSYPFSKAKENISSVYV